MTGYDAGRFLLIRDIENVLEREVLISPEMCNAMTLWDQMYRNRAPWLSEEIKSLNLASAVASELACQVTLDFHSNISGSRRAEVLNDEVYQNVVFDVRQLTEYACASGGIVLKPYMDRNRLAVEYVRSNRFFPLAVNSRGEIISAVFLERIRRKGQFFTRLEEHIMEPEGITVKNHAFRGSSWGLGKPIELDEVPEWSGLETCVLLAGAAKPLFSYFKVPLANIVDPDSPLGVSVFGRGAELIREADKQFSRLLWEYEGGELAIDASVDALILENGDMKLPKLSHRLFRALDIDVGGNDLYSVYAPTLRDSSYLDGLNEILIRLEDLCGLARGTFSNMNQTARTATELKILRQRSYATVTDIQKSLQKGLSDMVEGLKIIASAFSLLPPGDCDMVFEFDDSSVVDRSTQFEEMYALVNQGIMSKREFRTWYLGETEDQAEARLKEMQTDGK